MKENYLLTGLLLSCLLLIKKLKENFQYSTLNLQVK
jgi:hypothetical protein